MTPALPAFFDHYYRRRPVNASFTGVHTYDRQLPDWSPDGLAALDDEMRRLRAELARDYPEPRDRSDLLASPDLLDASLARDFLEIQMAENASRFGVRGNPALWTGEAVFGVISQIIRDFAPVEERMANAAARLSRIPEFLADARATLDLSSAPPEWITRALRDRLGAVALFGDGINRWILEAGPHGNAVSGRLRLAAQDANAALQDFAEWIQGAVRTESAGLPRCGPELFDVLLARGHRCRIPRAELLAEARERFDEQRARLADMARPFGGTWTDARERIESEHPRPVEYLGAFEKVWEECRAVAVSHGVVDWPDWPIRYVVYPEVTRAAAPYLYYLHYRSPAPFDQYHRLDYVVPQLPESTERHLRTWNHSVIKLNHVVHHGAIGHHVQNWFAYHRAPTHIGKIAAVDCANRIGMFCGGTMAEGWACYVTTLMDELGFLTPVDRIAEQHTRVRGLARAIVDIELHQGTMSLRDAMRLYVEDVGMSEEAARGEAIRNSMFPGAAIIYWLGTQSILDLREAERRRRGPAWSLKTFHTDLLSHGSIPVPLIADLMKAATDRGAQRLPDTATRQPPAHAPR